MTTRKAVTNGNGEFLGRLSMADTAMSWVGAARAYVYADEATAQAAAVAFGGTVCNAPVWSDATGRYEVP